MTKEVKIILGIAVLVIGVGVLLFSLQPSLAVPSDPIDTQSLVRASSHMTSQTGARVTVVEFGDYECPACKDAEPTFERLRTEFKDNANVNFVFRNFPLPQHQKALISAQYAEAAGEQNKFWEMHDKIYASQTNWIGVGDHTTIFLSLAEELGLDIGKVKESVQQNKFSEIISADQKDGVALGVNATPTFFINGEKTRGYSYEELKSKIEEKLK